MNIPYTCKFCGLDSSVTIADDYPASVIHLDVWIPRLCCNRCGNFMVGKRRMISTIGKMCFVLVACRFSLDDEKRSGVETRMKQNLESATKKLCALVCDYYRQVNMWDSEFYHQLIETPDESYGIIHRYISGVSSVSAK